MSSRHVLSQATLIDVSYREGFFCVVLDPLAQERPCDGIGLGMSEGFFYTLGVSVFAHSGCQKDLPQASELFHKRSYLESVRYLFLSFSGSYFFHDLFRLLTPSSFRTPPNHGGLDRQNLAATVSHDRPFLAFVTNTFFLKSTDSIIFYSIHSYL